MKATIRNIVIKIYLRLLGMRGRRILKCQMNHAQSVFCYAYIYTFSLFPENKLSYNIDLSLKVRQIICDLPTPGDIQEINCTDIDKLLSALKEDPKVRSVLADYFRFAAYYFSCVISSDSFKDKISNALSTASDYIEDIEPLTNEEAGVLSKNIKKIHNNLRKDIRQLSTERIEKEKLQLIEPIEIEQSHAIFAMSLFTTLFLIGGFVSVKFIYGSLGLRVGDFFSAADYISSSIDVLAPALISTVIGLAAMLFGLSSAIDKELREDQFEVNSKRTGYAFPALILLLTIGLVINSYKTGEMESDFLAPLLVAIAIFAFYRLPIWRYIKNRTPVGAILMSVLYFSLQLGFNIRGEIDNIKSEDYESPYIITYNSPYEGYTAYDFISGNSNFAFLYAKNDQKIVAVPRSAIKDMRSK
jgi:hypothetical protein